MNNREQAWGLLTEFTQSESLRKHGLAVEACMRAYARKLRLLPPKASLRKSLRKKKIFGASSVCCTISTMRSIPVWTIIPIRETKS